MNYKMSINTYLSTIESKKENKLSKQAEPRQNCGYGECFSSCQVGRGYVGMDEEVRGLRSRDR